jgi:glycosyltransferase involved in cell wall biosynthesis
MTVAVSIGLPVYNGGRYVAEAIESVLAQTFADFELVVCDNASTDETEEICRTFERRDDRVRYERNTVNIGAVGNHNRCIEHSTGRYFMWLGSDDVLGASLLEQCVAALDGDPSAALAFPRLVYIDSNGTVRGSQTRPSLSILGGDAGVRAWQLVRLEVAGDDEVYSAIYSLVRREVLLQTRLHGSYVAADQVLLFELVLGGKLIQVEGAEFRRRQHERSSMQTHRTLEERAAWFGADDRGLGSLVHFSLFAHHFRAVLGSRLSPTTKVRASAAVTYRAAREWRNLGGDLKQVVLRSMRRDRRRPEFEEGSQ